ncbi:hypothetical protein P4O66_004900 [Electrophorus voltai]|uniref:Immunoglobulin domain-containing protein n=1 Tax=Electrophorus voltai TaxID=2609070 RepID=A0AAD8ZW42_9TELE|nr:hypothetical protein P4O66_004900 [Electrophorus voltai]
MKFLWQHYLVIVWIIAERPLILSCVSVRFPSREPVYVALGRTLVLKAQFEVQPAEEIRLVTWDHKRGSQEVRLVTNNSPHNNRVTVEMDRQQLRLTGVQNSDYGHYTVMVTDDKGNQISASVEVLNVLAPDPDHKNWGLIAAVIIETVVIVCFIGYHCMEYLRRRKK